MKKHLANLITVLRIIGSTSLLFFSLRSRLFFTIYLFCGFSDMIDGTIARKAGTVSKFGADLDTVADFVFMAVCAVKLLPIINLPVLLWIWIAAISAIKINNIVRRFIRGKKPVDQHTVLNKITGFLLFLLPSTIQFIEPTCSFAIVCGVATVASIQECYYIVKANCK